MDTNNTEYQQALMELYAAVLKVLRLSGASVFTEKERHDEVLANMMALINSCGYKHSSLSNDSICTANNQQLTSGLETHSQQSVHVADQPIQPVFTSKSMIGKRYATMAEDDGNEYLFKRTKDRIEEGDINRYFVLTVYDDGTGTFEMTDDIVGEKLQMLLDNKSTLLSSGVVKTVGTISATCSIVTRTVGEVVKNGKSWRVVKPLEIEFR